MEYFHSQNLPSSQLLSINCCRVYFQLLSLSDMVSADGCLLIPQVLQGHKIIDRKSLLSWPDQQNPGKADWEIWGQAFSSLAPNNTLLCPIVMSLVQSHQCYFWFMDSNHCLFNVSESNDWSIYPATALPSRCTRGDSLSFRRSLSQACPPPMNPVQPVSIERVTPTIIKVIQWTAVPPTPTTDPKETPVLTQDTQLSHHPYYAFLYQDLILSTAQEQSLSLAISQGLLFAFCDGSYDPVSLSSSYGLVCGTQQSPLLRTQGPCLGHPAQMSAYHSELISISVSAYLFLYLCNKFCIEEGSITLYNNCKKPRNF
jgi:hypothetical protein